jgi:hypothetical protein
MICGNHLPLSFSGRGGTSAFLVINETVDSFRAAPSRRHGIRRISEAFAVLNDVNNYVAKNRLDCTATVVIEE